MSWYPLKLIYNLFEISFKFLTFENFYPLKQAIISTIFQQQRTDKKKIRETGEGKIKHIGLLVLYIQSLIWMQSSKQNPWMSQKMSTKITLLFNIAWKQARLTMMNLKTIFNLRQLNEFNIFTIPNSMFETRNVSSSPTFDLESGKLETELHTRTLCPTMRRK